MQLPKVLWTQEQSPRKKAGDGDSCTAFVTRHVFLKSLNLSQILNHGVVYPLSHPQNGYFQTESRHFKDRQKLTMTHCFKTP